MPQQSSHSSTDETQWQAEMEGHRTHVHLTGLRDTADKCRSSPGTPKAFSSLSTMRKLIGYVWLEAMGDTQFRSFQTGFLRKTDASHGVFVLDRASEIAKEWKTPLFLAQLDLKKAFDHLQHSFASTALQHKRVSEQLLSVLNKWWTQSDVAVSLAGTPAMFVAVDHVLGNLDAGWRNRNINWKMDNIHLTSTAYADDMCLLASSIKDLELMVKECIAGFLAAGLETGLDKTFWTSTTRSPNATLNVCGHTIPWVEKSTHVGAKIRVCNNSGSAMTNRLRKATGVFEKCSSIFCDTTLDLSKRNLCFRASVLSSLGWQSGSWTFTKKAAVPFGLLGCSAPRTHARSKKRTRGRHWFLLDAEHETAQHFSREYVPSTETKNCRSLRTSRQRTHCSKMAPLARAKLGSERKHVGTQHASLAADGNKISSSHTVGPREM